MKKWKKYLITSASLATAGIATAGIATAIVQKNDYNDSNINNNFVKKQPLVINNQKTNSFHSIYNNFANGNYLNANVSFYSTGQTKDGLTAKLLFNTTTMKIEMGLNASESGNVDLPMPL